MIIRTIACFFALVISCPSVSGDSIVFFTSFGVQPSMIVSKDPRFDAKAQMSGNVETGLCLFLFDSLGIAADTGFGLAADSDAATGVLLRGFATIYLDLMVFLKAQPFFSSGETSWSLGIGGGTLLAFSNYKSTFLYFTHPELFISPFVLCTVGKNRQAFKIAPYVSWAFRQGLEFSMRFGIAWTVYFNPFSLPTTRRVRNG